MLLGYMGDSIPTNTISYDATTAHVVTDTACTPADPRYAQQKARRRTSHDIMEAPPTI